MEDGEVYQLPVMGGAERLSGILTPTMDAFDLKKTFDCVLGHMIEHEQALLEEVKYKAYYKLENAVDSMETKQLLQEGAVFYGVTESPTSSTPIYFVPPSVYNSSTYSPITQDDQFFSDINWEAIFEHVYLWPMERTFFP
eukprot:2363761-Amphidinium_carterae.1